MTDRLDRTGQNPGRPLLNTHNGEVVDNFGPAFFFCPSSAVDRFVKGGNYQIALPMYVGISGATNYDGFPETRVSKCCRSDGQISAGGVLITNAAIRTRQIKDGLAKTLIVGEQSDFAYAAAGPRRNIGSAFAMGWLAGTYTLGIRPLTAHGWYRPIISLRYVTT